MGQPNNDLVEDVNFGLLGEFLFGEEDKKVAIHGEGVAEVGYLVFEPKVFKRDLLLTMHFYIGRL